MPLCIGLLPDTVVPAPSEAHQSRPLSASSSTGSHRQMEPRHSISGNWMAEKGGAFNEPNTGPAEPALLPKGSISNIPELGSEEVPEHTSSPDRAPMNVLGSYWPVTVGSLPEFFCHGTCVLAVRP